MLHTPSEVKAAVTGNGRADKAQVTAMVIRLLRLTDAPRPADAADALALAICHIWRGGAQARLAAAQAQATLARTGPAPVAVRQAAHNQVAQQQAAQIAAAQKAAALRQAALEQAALGQAVTRQTSWRQAGGPR